MLVVDSSASNDDANDIEVEADKGIEADKEREVEESSQLPSTIVGCSFTEVLHFDLHRVDDGMDKVDGTISTTPCSCLLLKL